ncbi:MAG: glycosyltransferase [Vicinamibacterales bacterium]
MRLLAITRRTQPKEAFHERPDFADLARHHDLCIICPVPWTAMMHAVVGGLRSDTAEWSDGVQVLYPTYFTTPGLQLDRDGTSFERSVRATVRGLVGQQKPDAILSSWSYPDGWAAVRLGQQTGLPVVLHVSGSSSPLPDGSRGERIIQELCGADAVIATSGAHGRRLVALGTPKHRVHVVPEGISRAQFHAGAQDDARRSLGLPQFGRIVLFAGDTAASRGATDLVKACAILRDRGIAFRCHFVGQKLGTSRLRRVIRSRGLEDHMFFAGVDTHADLADWFRACDVLALPSYAESIAVVLREAIECGAPFVTTRVGGNREIAHPSYSRLVIAGAIGDLADSLAEMLERPLNVPRDLVESVNLTREASAALFAEHLQTVVDRRSAMRTRRSHHEVRTLPLRALARNPRYVRVDPTPER